MTENKRYNLRAGYYHNYTGIGRNKEENLTTNQACDKLNELRQKVKEYEELLTPKCSTCKHFFNFPEYQLKGHENTQAYCPFRKIYLSDKCPETDCHDWWLNKELISNR